MHDISFVIRRAGEVPGTDDWLGADEIARYRSMRFAPRRADFALGRFAAHELLASLLGPGHDDVRAAADGAPEPWRDEAPVSAVISISHRCGVALCAGTAAGLRVGADLEKIEPRTDGFVHDFFTADEIARIAAAGERRDEVVTLTWSAKESALKALRDGLRADTRSVELVRAAPHIFTGWSALEVAAGRQRFSGRWRRIGSLVATIVADAPFALREA
jgi:4'-phosphopantetheinyl transferase